MLGPADPASSPEACLLPWWMHRQATVKFASALETWVIGCCRDGLTATAGSSAPAAVGEEIRDLQLLPGGRGLLAATGDCRILLLQPEVGLPGCEIPVSDSQCVAASGDSPHDFIHTYLAASCTQPTNSSAACLLSSVFCECGLRVQGKKKEGRLALARQLMGNIDEVTDLRLIGPPEAPSHLALASNSPAMRVFDLQTLNCTATLAGHTDTVLVLDATRTKGALRPPASSTAPTYVELAFAAIVGAELPHAAGAGRLTSSHAIRAALLSHCCGTKAAFVLISSLMLPAVGGATVLASGAKDNKIRLWTPSGACLAVGDGHAGAVSALAFSRKAPSFLVSGGVDKILKVPTALRPPDTSHSRAQSEARRFFLMMASCMLSGRMCAEGCRACSRVAWTDLRSSHSRELDAPLLQVWDVSGVAASLDSSASSEAPAQLQSTAVVAAHDKDINALAVSPNDALICTASQDRTAKVTSSRKGQECSI